MKIDAHQHFWRIERGDYGWLTPAMGSLYRDFGPADLAPLRATSGVAHTIVVQAAPTAEETQYLLALAETDTSIAGVVGWCDFDSNHAPECIAALADHSLIVGLRPMIHDIPDPDWMLSAAVQNSLVAMQHDGLVFDALIRPVHLSRVRAIAQRNPDLSIVVDHCAKPCIADGLLEPWAADMRALTPFSNVCVKLSGLATEAKPDWSPSDLAPYVSHVLACFGADRVIWGSDWPVSTMAVSYSQWHDVIMTFLKGYTADERAAIMGENARRIYLNKRGRLPC